MKTLLRVHRYLSCVLAPLLLFFAVSGAWQVLDLHESRKNGSYVAPPALQQLSRVHQAKGFEGTPRILYRLAVIGMSAAFVVAGGIGVVLAFRLTRPRWLAGVCLLAGVGLLLYLVTAGAPLKPASGEGTAATRRGD
jgi:hypothetical protein